MPASLGISTAAGQSTAASPVSPRWGVFVYQDAVLLCPTLRALDELGILAPSLAGERSLDDLYPELSRSGFGYMRVGLRCLASQGWLEREPTLDPRTTVLRWSDAGRAVAPYFDRYVAVGRFLSGFRSLIPEAWSLHWDAAQSDAFLSLLELACDRWRLGEELPPQLRALTTTHLDAGMVVPAMLSLRGARLLVDDGPAIPATEAGRGVGRFLAAIGWIEGSGRWTAAGAQARRFAVHYGMAASYLPLLARLPELYRGVATVAPTAGREEWHVHRGLNVIASAAAHVRYYADADGIFTELFDREPIDEQPRFVADMGCGDGSWLVHIHRLVGERTLRGRHADAYPLLMVGLDYSRTALEQARRVLDRAGVPALLALGDISDPDRVSATLAEHGLRMQDGLHVRAFIDHDRAYRGGDPAVDVRGWSSGAYVDPAGEPLAAVAVERDLVAHLRRWTPHVRRHGLVVLEAHCVAPRIARQHLGATHAVAFDAYHGYSHQYPVEHSSFLRCCRQAGLQPASHCERRYPASRPFVAVSLNRLLAPESQALLPALRHGGAREDGWQPPPGADLEDGRALHELLYEGGDLRYPRLWCSAATGHVVAGALAAIEVRLADAQPGDVIRVLDYGAGTGLAAIELLKACHERGIERRLERLRASLEIHLVDLPSSWFAQGFELLRDCGWTRFHSLRAASGGFRALLELTAGRRVDVLMANMVFHLLPRPALARAAADLAGALHPGGQLLWSSPDLGPPAQYAVLFHDANRALRARWLDMLAGERSASSRPPPPDAVDPTHPPHLREAIRSARVGRTAASTRAAQARADRRVLPQANSAEDVAAAFAAAFRGACELELQTHEILEDDLLDTLLVPSNQAEYVPEIDDRDLRERVIRSLMCDEILPAMRAGAAGTAVGLNVQWTLGRCAAA